MKQIILPTYSAKKIAIFFVSAILVFIAFFFFYRKPPVKNNINHTYRSSSQIRFAVIGDFGSAGPVEDEVAQMVKKSHPDFIVTTGDNNYPDGLASTIEENIGQYYGDYLGRFYPTLGNHDIVRGYQPYLDYFHLPENERYYDFVKGPIHFFSLNSNPDEPDGITFDSKQAQWLQQKLLAATEPFKIVFFHHPPFTSGTVHGALEQMRWPFGDWGVDVVLNGHEHNYERIIHDSVTYVVNGLSGQPDIYSLGDRIKESKAGYDKDYGALFVEGDDAHLTFTFRNIDGRLIDSFILTAKSS